MYSNIIDLKTFGLICILSGYVYTEIKFLQFMNYIKISRTRIIIIPNILKKQRYLRAFICSISITAPAVSTLHFLYLKCEVVGIKTNRNLTLNLHTLQDTLKASDGYPLPSKSDTALPLGATHEQPMG